MSDLTEQLRELAEQLRETDRLDRHIVDCLLRASAHIEELIVENKELRREEAVQWRDWETVELIDDEDNDE